MIKVHKKDYHYYKQEFYDEIKPYPIINAIVSDVQEGYVYTNEEKKILIVISKSGFSMVSFKNENLKDVENVFRFFTNETEIPNYLHIYNPKDFFLNYIEENYTQYKLRERIQYKYYQKKCDSIIEKLPAGYKVKKVQEIDDEKLDALGLDLFSRYWDSKEIFHKHSLGICILDQNENIAAICYSATHVDGVAEMDTLVLENYRGKGLMRLVSEPFFNLATSINSEVHWDTFIENKPSFILGEKFNPDFKNQYCLMSVFFDR